MLFNVAVVGVTGAVGQEFLSLLEERKFPAKEYKFLASARSAGKTIEFAGQQYTVEELTENSFEGVDIGHSDPEVEASTRQKLTWAVEVSEDFGVEHIVVHGDGAAGADDFAAWKAKALETLSWLLGESPDHIHIYLENTPMAMIDQMLAVYTEFDHPRMTLNLDIGHAFIEPQPRVIEWIEILGDRIGYSHLHNNNGKADRHQGVHDGEMACAEVLAALNEHAPEAIWSLEVDAGAFEDSLRFLAKHGFLPEPVGLDG